MPLTPKAILEALPPERARELATVRAVIRKHLPRGYEEITSKGMLVYQVPLRRYPDTYNGQPLWYAALAAPRSYLTLHFMPAYGSAEVADQLRAGFRAAGKKLDMGKACIRFTRADDLALDAVAKAIAAFPVERWIAIAKAARRP